MIRDRKQRARATSERLDRLPPHSPEAEAGVLGCVLLSPKECLGECVVKFGDVAAQVFYDPRLQMLYRVVVEMWDEPTLIDAITVRERLRNQGLLAQLGGVLGETGA